MKERPIIFSGPMVQKVLDGTKTQTRRPVKHKHHEYDGCICIFHKDKKYLGGAVTEPNIEQVCPYGVPGDWLWCKENWQYWDWTEDGMPWVRYAADESIRLVEDTPEEWCERLENTWADLSRRENFEKHNAARDSKWRPSIHMPRWASRLTLEVQAVRVERLQEIDGGHCDLRDEGMEWNESNWEMTECFKALWDSIQKDGYRWDDNPWVWVVTFERVSE